MTARTVQQDLPEWYAGVPRSIRRQTAFGVVLMVTLCGSFGAWAALAPLASAVIAPGSFVATGRNKIVQHLEGGIIETIYVAEGDHVAKDQPLVKLDETSALANARQLKLRRVRLEAIQARLHAQAKGQPTYVAPPSVLEGIGDPEIRAINEGQKETFRAERLKFENQIDLLKENISALEYQSEGTAAQIAAMQRQRELLNGEFETKAALLKSGIVTRSAVSVLERAIADADGDIARLQSEARVNAIQADKYRMQIVQTRDTMKQTSLAEMQAIEAELDAVRERIRDAASILDRTTIVAPVAGVVVRVHYHTSGGVIETGKPIVEILPLDVPLIIEAQIPRMQIDEVHLDQPASVRLSALNQRTTPILDGTVIYVSADAVESSTALDRSEVYLARVSIPTEQMARVKGFTPTPGMPAEILIQTHERTFFEYITKPIADSMARAFREH